MAQKKAGKPVGIAHHPQLGTIVVMDNGEALRLVVKEQNGQHVPVGWEPLPGFDVTPEDGEQPE